MPPAVLPASSQGGGTVSDQQQGRTLYLDCTAGSDTSDGASPGSAWRSLEPLRQAALGPGDSVLLRRGCTWTGGLSISGSGARGRPLTFSAYGTGTAPAIGRPGDDSRHALVVQGSYVVVEKLVVRDAPENGVLLAASAHHDVIRNVRATRVGVGFHIVGRNNVVTRSRADSLHMVVNTPGGDDDYGAVGYWVEGPGNEVSYSTCVRCRAPSHDYGYDGGFAEVYGGADNAFFHHNFANGTNGFLEITLKPGRSARNVRVSYNVIKSAGSGLCVHADDASAARVRGLRFENNTFFTTSPSPRAIVQCLSTRVRRPITLRNNIFSGRVSLAESGGFVHRNNLYNVVGRMPVGVALGVNERVGNPLFVNPRAGNYRLRRRSPAIDAGMKLGYRLDFDNRRVPVGKRPDLGAYEYRGRGSRGRG